MAKSRLKPGPKLMTDAMLEAVALRFRALAEPARLRLLQHLLAGERSVNELTEATGLTQTNASKHLATLHAAQLIERRKEGTAVFYVITDPLVHQLCDLMCERVSAQARQEARSLR